MGVEIDIRRAEPGDAPALALLGQATFLESFAHMLPWSDLQAHCRHEHAEARYAGWLAEAGVQIWLANARETGCPVGYAVVAPPDLPVPLEADDLELKRIYVLHRLQGSGLAAALMARAIAGASRRGAPRLLLGVNADNARAIAFYHRQGFARAGVRKFRVGDGLYDDLVLARPLA